MTTFESKIEDFQKALAARNILSKTDFTCCNTCGNYEVTEFRDQQQKAYLFWHGQEQERIDDQLDDPQTSEIDIWVNWDFFDNPVEAFPQAYQTKEQAYICLTNQVKSAGEEAGIRVEGEGDIRSKLKIHVPVSEVY